MQTWLALPRARGHRPAFENVTATDCRWRGQWLSARVLMGSLWGKTASVTSHAATIYAEICSMRAASVPIDADADERAVLLVEERRSSTASRSSRHLSILPGRGETLTARRPRGDAAWR